MISVRDLCVRAGAFSMNRVSFDVSAGVTTLHVTHHLEDAEQLADQVLLVKNGQIICSGNDRKVAPSGEET